MSPWIERVLRAAVVAAGVVVTVAGVLAMRLEDWPIYLAFIVLAIPLFGPAVELVAGLTMPMPGLALCLGFLYIGGLPILFLRNLAPPFLIQLLAWAVPPRWRDELVGPRWGRGPALPLLAADDRGASLVAADWSAFSLGLAIRWAVASAIAGGSPVGHPGAIVAAELAGYVFWGILSMLPVLSFRTVVGPQAERLRGVYRDLGLIMIVALTPFVVLITYGYAVDGLAGAVGWSLAALGLHFMLQRLNQRRQLVEEQNRRLETLNRELEHRERLSAIGKMSSVVSHQILQQLGIIRMHADLVRHIEPDGDPTAAVARVKENAARIEEALDDVNRVLTDLLVFSRDLKLNLYLHPLDGVLAECAEECRALAQARGVTLAVECPADLTLTLDKLKLKQAVVNVIRNALEVSSPGGRVTVEGAVRNGWGEIAVTDEGPGVPADRREAVFTPFFTTKEQGSGLGLAIAREFVVAHGGEVEVGAGAGGGARFVIRLPAQR